MIDFDKYDIVHVGVSGGKDSTAALLYMRHESGCPLEKLYATFCDTENEHEFTYDHVKMIDDKIHPVTTIKSELGFYGLAKKKKRFPSTKARFCTQYLKMQVTQAHIKEWQYQDKNVLLVSGIRANESLARNNMDEFALDEYYMCDSWRPLLQWTIEDVWAIHAKYSIPRNPLYDYGARRVGCFPCINSSKGEMRIIAEKFPERIDMIREKEKEIDSSFFPPRKIPDRFCSKEYQAKDGRVVKIPLIDDVVEWSKTGKFRPDQFEMNFDEDKFLRCDSSIGHCE